jgi:hypothetical protein
LTGISSELMKKSTSNGLVDDIMDDVADKDDQQCDVHDKAGSFDSALFLVDEGRTVVKVPHGLFVICDKLNYSKGIFDVFCEFN